MARVLENFPNNRRGNAGKYPWDEWMDGRIWELSQGEDFTISMNSMRNSVYQAATRRNFKVRMAMTKKDAARGIITIQKTGTRTKMKGTRR